MILNRIGPWTAVIIVASLQTLALGYMVWERTSLLANGREILLDVAPVDPRSLFRGDYVILNYRTIAQLDGSLLAETPTAEQNLYVTLQQSAENGWVPVAASTVKPARTNAGDVILRGRVDQVWQPNNDQPARIRMHYGIESYFLPEGEGLELEKTIREGEMKVIVAVGASGESAIKGLEIAGQRVYDEPLL